MNQQLAVMLDRLREHGCEPKRQADGSWKARCPAHDDHNPSLSITEGGRQPVVYCCHAGCNGEIPSALGLSQADLCRQDAPKRPKPKRRIVTTYDYTDLDGNLRFQILRYDPKDFNCRRPDGNGGWIWKRPKDPVLYRLPAVVDAVRQGRTVYLCAGEKDADAVSGLGVTATTKPFGETWEPRYNETLRGANLVIIRDRDEKGHRYAPDVFASLQGVAASVRIVEAKEGKDAADHVGAGHGLEDFVPVEIPERAEQTDAPAQVDEQEPHPTELGISERLVQKHGEGIRYCFPWSTWLVWDGRRWAKDREGSVVELAKGIVRDLHAEAAAEDREAERRALASFALRAERDSVLRGAAALARSSVPVLPEALDRDVFLLNTPSGTVDLRTGELRPHDRADLLTKLCPTSYDPEASAPTFERFLLEIMGHDAELCLYLQRVYGYAATGCGREHVLIMEIGRGGNGKSTLNTAVRRTLGPDYAGTVAPALLFQTRTKDSHPTGLADLQGKRVAVTHELDSGTRLAEGTVKSATGGDRIKARRMRQDFFEFTPTHTLFLCANTRPVIRGTDDGIWRRLRLIPFRVQIPASKEDKKLGDKLKAEDPGILAWIVQGARSWLDQGLDDPQTVREATAAYRSEQDVLGDFLESECNVEDGARVEASELYKRFSEWHKRTLGGDPWNQTTFGRRLTDRGIEPDERRSGGVRWRLGVELR